METENLIGKKIYTILRDGYFSLRVNTIEKAEVINGNTVLTWKGGGYVATPKLLRGDVLESTAAVFLFDSMNLDKIIDAFEEFTKYYEIVHSNTKLQSEKDELIKRQKFLENLKAYQKGYITDPFMVGYL